MKKLNVSQQAGQAELAAQIPSALSAKHTVSAAARWGSANAQQTLCDTQSFQQAHDISPNQTATGSNQQLKPGKPPNQTATRDQSITSSGYANKTDCYREQPGASAGYAVQPDCYRVWGSPLLSHQNRWLQGRLVYTEHHPLDFFDFCTSGKCSNLCYKIQMYTELWIVLQIVNHYKLGSQGICMFK